MARPLPPRQNLDDVASFVVTCKAGQPVFSQGDDSRELYVIDEGAVDLLVDGAAVANLGPGGVFGEHSFFHGVVRDITAKATSTSKLFKLDRATFEQLVSEAPEIGVLLLAQYGREARKAPPVTPAPPPAAAVPVAPPPGRLDAVATGASLALPPIDDITVGRLDLKAGITPDIDLTALDVEKTIGRRHARLVRRAGALFVVEDKATANGTFVNGTRIAAGAEVEVPEGAAVRFGTVDLVFRRQ